MKNARSNLVVSLFAVHFLLLSSVVAGSVSATPDISTQDAGYICVGCVSIVDMIKVEAESEGRTIEDVVKHFCEEKFGNGTFFGLLCEEIVQYYGNDIINLLNQDVDPDDVCYAIEYVQYFTNSIPSHFASRLCKNQTCRLYPKTYFTEGLWKVQIGRPRIAGPIVAYLLNQWLAREETMEFIRSYRGSLVRGAPHHTSIRLTRPSLPSDEPPWDRILKILDWVFVDHEPLVDFDNDSFSTINGFRGANWRGRDCNDFDHTIHPGRSPFTAGSQSDAYTDTNCNGIFGTDDSGTPYEELYCSETPGYGIVVLGDSASAHFHIPLNASIDYTYQAWEITGEDEMDWPMCSWSTAYYNTSDCPWAPLTVDSLYLQLRSRNRCNHRDYQNLSVNGARSTSMARDIMYSIARNQTTDRPAIVFYALIGNDVCNPHPGASHMTPPSQFYEMVTTTLQYLDTRLPAGSHVALLGLTDGWVIWEVMSNQTHPLGVTYADLWEFLSCLQISPCWGWLNKDPYWRNFTSEMAAALSNVLYNISTTQQYKHFDVMYVPNQDHANLEYWVASGGNPVELFEIVGGGHPSQLMHELNARALWNIIAARGDGYIGAVNPNNAEIEKIFGGQGGY